MAGRLAHSRHEHGGALEGARAQVGERLLGLFQLATVVA